MIFFTEQQFEFTNNLETIWIALDYYYRDRKDKSEIVSSLMKQIVDSFILQILTGNVDLHNKNLVLLDGEKPMMAPNFDYNECGMVLIPYSSYRFRIFPLDFLNDDKAQDTIEIFFSTSSCEYFEYFQRKVMMMLDIESIFHIMETQIECELSLEVKEMLCYRYQNSKAELLDIIEQVEIKNGRKR